MTTTAVSNSRTQIMLLMGDVTHRNEKIVGRTSDLIVKVNSKFNNLDSLSFPLGSEPTMQSSFLKLGKLLTAATKPTRERSKLQRSLSLKSTFNFFDTEQRYFSFSSAVTFLNISQISLCQTFWLRTSLHFFLLGDLWEVLTTQSCAQNATALGMRKSC